MQRDPYVEELVPGAFAYVQPDGGPSTDRSVLRVEKRFRSIVNGNVRPSPFFVVPGSSRTSPAFRST